MLMSTRCMPCVCSAQLRVHGFTSHASVRLMNGVTACPTVSVTSDRTLGTLLALPWLGGLGPRQ